MTRRCFNPSATAAGRTEETARLRDFFVHQVRFGFSTRVHRYLIITYIGSRIHGLKASLFISNVNSYSCSKCTKQAALMKVFKYVGILFFSRIVTRYWYLGTVPVFETGANVKRPWLMKARCFGARTNRPKDAS